MSYKFVKLVFIIIEIINYKLMKNRRKIFFAPIPNVSLLQILLMIISSLSYFIIIFYNLLKRNLHLSFKKLYSSETITRFIIYFH
jgi:hypothetical protein